MDNLVWQKISNKIVVPGELTINEFDNDPESLEKEKNRFQLLLKSVHYSLSIHHLEQHDDLDLFVLTVNSMDYGFPIRNLITELGPQYSVCPGEYKVPMKGFEQHDMCPRQNTLAITRVPQKKLTRALPLSIGTSAIYLFFIVLLCTYFYRIVLA